jgi:hypothetical protein
VKQALGLYTDIKITEPFPSGQQSYVAAEFSYIFIDSINTNIKRHVKKNIKLFEHFINTFTETESSASVQKS